MLLAIAAVAIVLWTPWGTRTALRVALERYDAAVPGHVEIGTLTGTLGSTVVLHDLVLADAGDQPLIVIETAVFDLRLAALFDGTVGFGELAVSGLQVHVGELGPNFGDLAPPDDGSGPKPQEPGKVGPDLPIGFAGKVTLQGGVLVRHAADGTSPWIELPWLQGDLRSFGREATLHIDATTAAIADAPVTIASIAATVAWDDPVVRLTDVAIVTDRGVVRSAAVRFDAYAIAGDVELDAMVDLGALVPGVATSIAGPVDVRVDGGGDAEGAGLAVALATEPDARIEIVAGGRISAPTRLAAMGTAHARAPGSVLAAPTEVMFVAALTRDDADAPIVAVAEAFVAETSARAQATLAGGQLTAAQLDAEVPSIAGLLATVSPWIPMPAVTGELEVHSSCHRHASSLSCGAALEAHHLQSGEHGAQRVRVDAVANIGDGAPAFDAVATVLGARSGKFDVASLGVRASGTAARFDVDLLGAAEPGRIAAAASIAPGPTTEIDLSVLSVDLPHLRARLEHPTRVAVGPDAVAIDDLRLAVNRGSVALAGTWGRTNDGTLAVRRIDLGALAALHLPVALAGRVDAEARVRGTIADPSLDLHAAVVGLVVDRHALGDADATLRLANANLAVDLDWLPGPEESVALHARARLRNLEHPGAIAIDTRRPATLALRVDELSLTRLQPFVGAHRVAGTLDATIVAEAHGRDLRLVTSVDLRSPVFDDLDATRIHLDGVHEHGHVSLGVDARAAWLGGLRVAVEAPLQLTLADPYVRLEREDAVVAVVLDDLRLGRLAPIRDLGLRGRVDGVVEATVVGGELATARTRLVGRDLSREGEKLATASFEASIGEQGVIATVLASGPIARLVEAHAEIPLRVDAGLQSIHWRRDDPHRLSLALAGVDLAAVGRLVGVAGTAGRIDGSAVLEGPLGAPKLAMQLEGDAIAWQGHSIGGVEFSATHDRDTIDVVLRQHQGRQRVGLDASIPVHIDLARGEARWIRSGEHRVDLDAVAVDRELVTAFVALPDALEFTLAAEVVATGNSRALQAHGRVRADLDDPTGPDLPISASFEIGPELQQARAVLGPIDASALELSATAHVAIARVLRGEAIDWDGVAIAATLATAGFPIHGLAGLLPDTLSRPEGVLDAQLAVAGTLGSPRITGRAELQRGSVTVVPMRQRFEQLSVLVSVDGPDVRLREFSARSGPGRLRATGQVHLVGGATTGKLELRLDGLPIVRPGLPLMKLTTRATVDLDATGPRTEVDIVAKRSILDVFTDVATAPTPLPDSTGVVFVEPTAIAVNTKAAAVEDTSPVIPPSMRLRMRLGDPLFVRGPQANMTWRGAVEVDRAADGTIAATGAFSADRGRINFLGRDFVIDSARVTLPTHGEIDPFITLTAVTQVEEATVTITVRGRASRPELRLSSDPSMPESDVFALLVTGSSNSGDSENATVSGKAASVLAAFQNPALQRALQDRVGIDRVGLGFGENVDQPIVAVGKRITRRIYVETRYHHNAPTFENTAEVHVEYDIKPPAWSLETFIGDAAKGGVQLWWRKRFGRPRGPDTKVRVAGPRRAASAPAPQPRQKTPSR